MTGSSNMIGADTSSLPLQAVLDRSQGTSASVLLGHSCLTPLRFSRITTSDKVIVYTKKSTAEMDAQEKCSGDNKNIEEEDGSSTNGVILHTDSCRTSIDRPMR